MKLQLQLFANARDKKSTELVAEKALLVERLLS